MPNGKVFMVFRRCRNIRLSDHTNKTPARIYTENTISKLMLIGEIVRLDYDADDFYFVSTNITDFTKTSMLGFLKIFKRRYHLSHVHKNGEAVSSYYP